MIDPDGKPHGLSWTFSRAEIVADGIIHALGALFALAGGIVLLVLCARSGAANAPAVGAIYAATLLAALGTSGVYNLWPVSRAKWLLRRFDHSTIYLLIAGTYTPFLAQLPDAGLRIGLLAFVWGVAGLGIAIKLAFPGRFDRLSIAVYLALGWCGLVGAGAFVAVLSPVTLWLLGIGGMLYSAGVVFHVWSSLQFQNAIWHAFVLGAAACHYAAVMDTLVVTAR